MRATIAALLLALACFAQTTPQTQRRPSRRTLLMALSDHLVAAMGNAPALKPKDRKKLDNARARVLELADLRGGLNRSDRDHLRSALKDIEKRASAFRPEDRGAVLADIGDIRRQGLDRQPPPRRVRMRPLPPPRRWPPYYRFPLQ